MNKENIVLACVDHSRFADDVADHAAWAARRMDAPLEFLHVIDRHAASSTDDDHSGAIGIDAQEQLLDKLSAEDGIRAKQARERGRLLLHGLQQRALAAGAPSVDIRQRYGDLDEAVVERQRQVRLVVLGRRGESAELSNRALGRQVETVVRALQRPILTVTDHFREPERVMIAFDGGKVTRRGVEMVAGSPLFRGLPIELLMCSEKTADAVKQLEWARSTLATAGFEVQATLTPGDAETLIANGVRERAIDLLIMGAFSHSPLRTLLFGSKTAELLRSSTIPTLLLR